MRLSAHATAGQTSPTPTAASAARFVRLPMRLNCTQPFRSRVHFAVGPPGWGADFAVLISSLARAGLDRRSAAGVRRCSRRPRPRSSHPLPPLDGPNGKVARFVPKAAGHRGEDEVLVRALRRPAGPRHEPRRPRPADPRRLHGLGRARHAPRQADLSEPTHQEAHIHHAHWFALDPGNEEDNYIRRQHRVDLRQRRRGDARPTSAERSAADPNGPDLRPVHRRRRSPQPMIYMLHNKTRQPLDVYIVLDVTFIHGTPEELKRRRGRAVPRRHAACCSAAPTTCRASRTATASTSTRRGRRAGRSSGPRPSTARSSAPAATCTPAA